VCAAVKRGAMLRSRVGRRLARHAVIFCRACLVPTPPHAGQYPARRVDTVRCRTCRNEDGTPVVWKLRRGDGETSVIDTLGPTLLPLSAVRLRQALSADDAEQHFLQHSVARKSQTDHEFSALLEACCGDTPGPHTLHLPLLSYRLLETFPLARAHGFRMPCIACGDSALRFVQDGNLKADCLLNPRHAKAPATSPLLVGSYFLDGASLLGVRDGNASLKAVTGVSPNCGEIKWKAAKQSHGGSGSGSGGVGDGSQGADAANGSSGTAAASGDALVVAGGGRKKVPLHFHGLYVSVCMHAAFYALSPLYGAENYGDKLLGLLMAALFGARILFDDTYCHLDKYIGARIRPGTDSDPGFADALVSPILPGCGVRFTMPAEERWLPGPPMQLHFVELATEAAAQLRAAPGSTTDDLPRLQSALGQRLQAMPVVESGGRSARVVEMRGGVPALHSHAHSDPCQVVYASRVVSGGGLGSEVRWLGQFLREIAPLGTTMVTFLLLSASSLLVHALLLLICLTSTAESRARQRHP
jgi:hypothetical protein